MAAWPARQLEENVRLDMAALSARRLEGGTPKATMVSSLKSRAQNLADLLQEKILKELITEKKC